MTLACEFGVSISSCCDVKDHSEKSENSQPAKDVSSNIRKAAVITLFVNFLFFRKIVIGKYIYLFSTRGRKNNNNLQ